jgi:UDP-glucose 4-epimerase
MEYVILIPHNIIGPKQCFEDPYRNVAAIMINRILQGKRPIIYGDGEQQRCFSFIDDVISCFEQALLSPYAHGETINAGPDESPVTVNALCLQICALMGVPFNPIYVTERPLEVKVATCSADKARRLLNYRTKTTLEEGLAKMVEYIRRYGPLPFKYNRPLEINNALTPVTWTQKMM